ncbi:MAG: M10 family metallopeptidase C-terminal domain-containing protein [Beijerinckiaceae bacterium]
MEERNARSMEANMATINLLTRLIYGTSKNDTLSGTAGSDIIYARSGSDLIFGSASADTIYGDDEGGANYSDTVSYANSALGVRVDLRQVLQQDQSPYEWSAGIDDPNAPVSDAHGDMLYSIENVTGSAYDDILTGNGALNVLNGGNGNDTLNGGIDGFADVLDGGAGVDTVDYSESGAGVNVTLDRTTTFATVYGVFTRTADGSVTVNGVTEDVLRNIENVTGSAFNDTITGNEKNNVIDGGFGADIINGGAGSDTIDYSGFGGEVDIDLMRTAQKGGAAEGDRLTSIENVTGTYRNDTIRGDNGSNRLDGSSGSDTIEGRGGNDVIIGGRGADILDGGAGFDVFVYENLTDSYDPSSSTRRYGFGVDTIVNFETGTDRIDLRGVDANSLTTANDAFVFTNEFTGSAGQLMYDGAKLMGDVNGDKIADFTINVTGLSHSDVML